MTLQELQTSQSRQARLEEIRDALNRNKQIRGAYISGADSYKATRPLTLTELKQLTKKENKLRVFLRNLRRKLWTN